MNYSYNSVDLEKVLIFAKENKDKIYMPIEEINSNQLSKDQVDKIINNINNLSCLSTEDKNKTKKFLLRLLEIFIYVNFDEFLRTIKIISEEIKSFLLSNNHKYELIFFGGYDENILKSYSWILFLFLNELIDFFNENPEIRNKIQVGGDDLKISQSNTNKYLLLFFDDMSYSGTQLESSIANERNSVNLDIYITTPYISETAVEKIRIRNNKVNFWSNIKIIPKLKSLFLKELSEIDKMEYEELFNTFCNNITSKFYKAYQCYENMIPIYFDHKIADGLSTFQKLIYFGIYPINKDNPLEQSLSALITKSKDFVDNRECIPICNRSPLIKKCENQNLELDNDVNYCESMIVDIEDEDSCPKTFYKNIIYNFKSDLSQVPNYKKLSLVKIIKYYDDLGKFTDLFSIENKYFLKYLKYKKKYLSLKNHSNKL